MNPSLSALDSQLPTVDPELSALARFFAWLNPAADVASIMGEICVRIAGNARGGVSLFPANPAAVALMGEGETGNFATPADARKRAAWNAWEVVETEPAILRGSQEPGLKSLRNATGSPSVQAMTGSLPCLKTIPSRGAARGGEAVSSPTGAIG